jgi:hypothetical protein
MSDLADGTDLAADLLVCTGHMGIIGCHQLANGLKWRNAGNTDQNKEFNNFQTELNTKIKS